MITSQYDQEVAPRMLLIDDDSIFGNLMSRKAAARGLDLDYFETLLDALYERYLDRYDVALVDCSMPGIDGFEVSKYVSCLLKHVPVVLISSSVNVENRDVLEKVGASAFIDKRQGIDAILRVARRVSART